MLVDGSRLSHGVLVDVEWGWRVVMPRPAAVVMLTNVEEEFRSDGSWEDTCETDRTYLL
jgi:hypothetical protein